jgi:hypothetical protein
MWHSFRIAVQRTSAKSILMVLVRDVNGSEQSDFVITIFYIIIS